MQKKQEKVSIQISKQNNISIEQNVTNQDKVYKSEKILTEGKSQNDLKFFSSQASLKKQQTKSVINSIPSQTSLTDIQTPKQQMTKQQIQILTKILTEIRQFKIDNENKIKLVSPTRKVLLQMLTVWKSRAIKNINFVFHLYLTELNKEDVQFSKQQCKYFASIKLYIDGQETFNKQAVHFLENDQYYEGIKNEYMMITRKLNDDTKYYQGQVKGIQPNGIGQLIEQSKGRLLWNYRGDFVDGKKQGKGVEILPKNVIYEGQFKNNMRNGKGLEITKKKRKHPQQGKDDWIQTNRYLGNFQNDLRQGEGVETTRYGQYTGQWHDDLKQGKGTIKYKNGHSYQGQWENNSFHGQGVYIQMVIMDDDMKQNVYKGEFKDGYYHGNGTMDYANGDKYEGEWAFGKKEGQGMYNYADGDYYDGNWEKDSAEGTGAACFQGKFYDGEFHLGLKHGLGEQTDEDGNTIKAIWQNNQIIKKLEINGQIVQE